MHEFFMCWPGPVGFLKTPTVEIENVIKPLGLQTRRALNLLRMTEDFLSFEFGSGIIPMNEMYGIGKYAADSWHIFVDPAEIKEDVEDKELKKYVEWTRLGR